MKQTFIADNSSITKETLSSIELTKTSKGYSWSIKIYFDETSEGGFEEGLSKLREVETAIKREYGGLES